MSAKYPYYLLADSREGRAKEQVVSGKIQPELRQRTTMFAKASSMIVRPTLR